GGGVAMEGRAGADEVASPTSTSTSSNVVRIRARRPGSSSTTSSRKRDTPRFVAYGQSVGRSGPEDLPRKGEIAGDLRPDPMLAGAGAAHAQSRSPSRTAGQVGLAPEARPPRPGRQDRRRRQAGRSRP